MASAKEELLKKIEANKKKFANKGAAATVKSAVPFSTAPETDELEDSPKFSDFFDIPKGYKDFNIHVFEETDWDMEVRNCIPEFDKDFIHDSFNTYWMMYCMEKNKRCIATGKPGTGKTACVRNLAAITKRPYIRINGMAGLDPSDQIGALQAKDGSTFYALGDAAIAVKHGAVLAYDEPFKNSASVNMCYQNLAEEDHPKLLLYGHPEFDQRHLVPDERFRFFLCDNVKGTGDDLDKYAATEIQDSSFLNRMSIILSFNYLQFAQEVDLLTRKFSSSISEEEAKLMVKLANEIRKAWDNDQLDHPYSPRNLLEWAKAYIFCGNIAEAFKRTYSYEGEKDDIKGVIQQFWRDVAFPVTL